MVEPEPPFKLLLDDHLSHHWLLQSHSEEIKILPGRHWVLEEVDGHWAVSDGTRFIGARSSLIGLLSPEHQIFTIPRSR